MKKIALLLLLAAPAFAQRCTSHIGVSTTASGYVQVIPPPADTSTTIHVCAAYLSVTQGATPANFQLKGCSEATCATAPVQSLTPLWTGHASYLDYYNLQPNEDVQLPVSRGNGIYLYLSSAPTAAQIQVFYAAY